MSLSLNIDIFYPFRLVFGAESALTGRLRRVRVHGGAGVVGRSVVFVVVAEVVVGVVATWGVSECGSKDCGGVVRP